MKLSNDNKHGHGKKKRGPSTSAEGTKKSYTAFVVLFHLFTHTSQNSTLQNIYRNVKCQESPTTTRIYVVRSKACRFSTLMLHVECRYSLPSDECYTTFYPSEECYTRL